MLTSSVRNLERVVIVTGALRSGTTMLAGDISELLRIKHEPEATPLSDALKLVSKWRTGYEKKRFESWIVDDKIPDALADFALQQFFLMGGGFNEWKLGKCPELVLVADEIIWLMRRHNLKVVLCIREPLDVCASALDVQKINRFGHSRNFYLERIWRSFEGVLKLIESEESSECLKVVRYESYVENAKFELASIGKFLNLPDEYSSEVRFKRTFDTSDPYFTDLLDLPPTDVRVNSFTHRLLEEEQIELAEMFSGVRLKLGYV